MWTNVFKIGGLHQISWFQFFPSESDSNTLPDISVKAGQNDASTSLVLWSHLQLQKEGFLSTWTNTFVGPWDPSQGIHNPDEKIKLWLFLPGRHSSVPESAQTAVSRLRVVGSGLWVAPGDSEEVAIALSQALRNRIERALRGISYMRYGDVFTRCHPFSRSGNQFRRVQPTIEFIFAATEEALFVHAIISAKHIRALSSDDMERVLGQSSWKIGEKLRVIVAPHGMQGRLSGCCPSDLVKQVYFSSNKIKVSNGFTVMSIPPNAAQASGCQLRGQSCYVEVTLGFPGTRDKEVQSNNTRNGQHLNESHVVTLERDDHKHGSERTFIYPAEAVMVPVIQTAFARSSLKRFWLQNWAGASLFGSCFLVNCLGFGAVGGADSIYQPWIESNTIYSQRSSSNSNSSSISSVSSTSSDSDYHMTSEAGDLEADADSLTCRQSGLSSNSQLENEDHKQVSKRPRTGATESFGGSGSVIKASMEVNNSSIAGATDDQAGSHWDWDNDDRVEMDIQILLSDFGDFGDFFENDSLPFGEPPGTAESQAIVYPVLDGEVSGSPFTGAMDGTDQMLLPALEFPSFDSLNPLPEVITDDSNSKQQEFTKDTWSSVPGSNSAALSAGEFDTLSRAEAMMAFAPEYTAVETLASELVAQTFKSPYVPISKKVENSTSSTKVYVYGANPPSCLTVSDEKSQNAKAYADGHESGHAMNYKDYYTHVKWGKEQSDGGIDCKSIVSSEGLGTSSLSGFNSVNAIKSVKRERTENNTEPRKIFLSLEIVFASEAECIMFQASMCRIRHMLLSSSNPGTVGMSSITGNTALEHPRGDSHAISEKTSSWHEVKKKESIPVRIAGDVDVEMLDGPLNPIGVWRSVGVPKGAKHTSSPSMDNTPSFNYNSFNEENRLIYGQRQPLQELLDAMALLVQQATSFVDIALDAEHGDGPFGWLALEEQCRRGFCCGPSMVHAGCGGVLAACHSLDIAGVELLDPLSAKFHASSVIGLLHSDIKVALKAAFGNLDGPLLVTDWCKGRSQLSDSGTPRDGYMGESIGGAKDSSSSISLAAGEPISPSNSSSGSSCLRDVRVDEIGQRRLNQEIGASEPEQQTSYSRLRPTLLLLPLPSILVGYQDDWLKTSTSSLQLWEKAPLEPYALPKHMTYYVVCPDIDPLASAAADFFQQLGTVYETCKLGTHTPQNMGAQTDVASGKWASSGFVMIDCPQSMKMESGKASIMGSISDYLLALSNAWEMKSFLKSLSNVLKALRLGSNSTTNQKEGSNGPGMVIYVVCPFPEPLAVLLTVIESSISLGSVIVSADKERRSILHNQVGRALSYSAAVDEASVSSILTLSGFCIPKLVLQIVTVEAILRVTSPALNELVLLKEIAFTVYNKSRRLARVSSTDVIQAPGISARPQSSFSHMTSPISGMWKDCIAPRITGSLPREGELDTGLRGGAWENAWQTSRTGGLNCDQNRLGDKNFQDDVRYLFEPLFILAEPGSVEQGVSHMVAGNAMLDPSRLSVDDANSGGFVQSSTSVGMDIGSSSLLDGTDSDALGHSHPKTASLHCCYGWTEDWRWLVCIWTDSRGEFLDSQIFPFGGIGSRQDTKGLQCLFVQVLHQGCQILSCSSPDTGAVKPRDIVITRIGCFYELERQEWQKAIHLVGGNEVKKWSLQLRRSVPDGISPNNGGSLHQQDISLIQERTVPSSPSPSIYSPQTKSSGFIKGGLGQTNSRKQLSGQSAVDSSRGLFQWVQSISLVGVSVDHTLHLTLQADTSSPGGGAQAASGTGSLGYMEGFNPVKSLGSTSTSYVLIPSPSMHFLPPTPLQLPTCLTSDSPPLAHLLHSKGSAIPLSTGFVVSKAVPSIRKDTKSSVKEEWPSILSVSLVDYYGSSNIPQEKMARGNINHGRNLNSDARDHEIETHLILENVAAELHALSWMTASPAYLERRTALPFHCDMILRLRRLIHYADKEICQKPDKVQM